MKRVHVIGASGRSGLALCRALLARGVAVVAVVRRPERLGALPVSARVADLADAGALAAALADATHVASAAHARFAGAVIAAAPVSARLVFMGSTRRFTRWPDAHGNGVIAGEAALMASARDGVMLHPTMIYGAEGEDNVRRLARLLRRLPVLPLPGGGRSLVQPIHQDDVTACLVAALGHPWHGPHSMAIAGPVAVRYADFVRAVAAAAGARMPPVVPVPAWLLMAASPVTLLPGLPRVRPAEIRRLLEDKSFSTDAMRQVLGVTPVGLEEGLRRTFAAG